MTNIPDIFDITAMADEPLDPDLAPYVETNPAGWTMLRHPLVFSVPFINNGMANRAYEAKKRGLRTALSASDWHSVVFLHERPYRTQALVEYVIGLDDDGLIYPLHDCPRDVQALAGSVWTDSENLHQYEDEWAQLFRDAEGKGLVIGSASEVEEFEKLPETLTIYRAEIEDGGWSWTLERRIAEFFAHRFDSDHPIIEATCRKSDVFGYLTRRGEAEILIEIDKVQQ